MKKILLITILIIVFLYTISCRNTQVVYESIDNINDNDLSSSSGENGEYINISEETQNQTLSDTKENMEYISSRSTILDKWNGKQLNILVSRYGPTINNNWVQFELNPSQFGESMVRAYNDRQAIIKTLYGVDVNWIESEGNPAIRNDIEKAISSNNLIYELAKPRSIEAFFLINSVYNLNGRKYINLSNDYYDQEAYKMFTLYDKTLFISANYEVVNNESSKLLFINKDLLDTVSSYEDLYSSIINGTWTYEKFISIARLIQAEKEGDTYTDDGTYGFGTLDKTSLYSNVINLRIL